MTFSAEIDLMGLDDSNGFALNGIDIGHFSGRSVSNTAIGDIPIGTYPVDGLVSES